MSTSLIVADAARRLPTRQQVGIAGEHYVAMRLAMAGVTPSLPPAGTPIVDLTAILDGKSCTVQVKTQSEYRSNLDLKLERALLTDFLVIVNLDLPDGAPSAYVIPHRQVQTLWNLAGYNHVKRPNLLLSKIGPQLEPYEEAWHLIADALEGRGRAVRAAIRRHD